MSHVHKPPLTKEQTSELVLKYLDTGEMPHDELLNSKELTAFLFNMAINDPLLTEKAKFVSYALYRIKIRFCYDVQNLEILAGLKQRNPGKSNSPYMIDVIKAYPQLLIEIPSIPNDLREHCYKILGTKTKQLRPFTSEYFEQNFAVGSIIMIRFNKAKYIRRVQLTEIIYKPDSVSEISAVTFGGHSYTLEDLKDNLEYFQNDQWLPFGVYE